MLSLAHCPSENLSHVDAIARHGTVDDGHAHPGSSLLDDLAYSKANIPAQRGAGRRGIIASPQPKIPLIEVENLHKTLHSS
ncbi:hypothetical protein [Pseudonocardia sp. TMWB2A]|uniref:hypothetical protein n=1 Tax=Pseudonocardia sp. TMWB2A TaxID=687430 RepID=UPI00307FCD1F